VSEGRLQGAYVQAWVWVDIDGTKEVSDEDFRTEAKELYAREGLIEIDDSAEVSRSYEGG